MKRYLLFAIAITLAFSSFAQTKGTFKDSRDGKTYKTVKIGNQTWMAENLAYKPSSGNFWAYGNDVSNLEKYGYLYDWETANKVCPSGWHLPSDDEWNSIKSTTGFDIVKSGFYNKFSSKFFDDGTYWWTSNGCKKGETERTAYCRYVGENDKIDRFDEMKNHGMAIRCIKD